MTEEQVIAAAQVLADRFNDGLGWARGSIENCPNSDGTPGGLTGFIDDARAMLEAAFALLPEQVTIQELKDEIEEWNDRYDRLKEQYNDMREQRDAERERAEHFSS